MFASSLPIDGGIAGLSFDVLLLCAAMILLAIVEMALIAYLSSILDLIGSVSMSRPRFSIPSLRGQLKQDAETSHQAVESEEEQSESDHLDQQGGLLLTDIEGVGETRADAFRAAGYETVATIGAAGSEALSEVNGVGIIRATTIRESAEQLLSEFDGTASASTPGAVSNTIGGETDTPPEDDTPTLTEEFSPGTEQSPESDSDAGQTVDDPNAETDDDNATSAPTEQFAPRGDTTSSGEDTGTGSLSSARATVAEVVRRACGHTRMLFDRRALDPRAYGATDDWTALTFECSERDGDSEPVRELLEETAYIGEVAVEIAGETLADRPEWRLPAEANVRVSREGIVQVERAAQAGKPEAKRTVTLLRRALHAEEEQAIRGSMG